MEEPRLRFKGFVDGWKETKLGNVAKIFDGTHQTPKYRRYGVPFVSAENIMNLKTKKYISQEDYDKEYKNSKPQQNDLLMTRIGSIGLANIVKNNDPLAYYVTLALIKPCNRLNSLFLLSLISSTKFKTALWRKTLHIAFPPKINKNEIPKINLYMPSLAEQQKIGAFFSDLDRQIELQSNKLKALKRAKKGYLQRMFPNGNSNKPKLRFKGFNDDWKTQKLKSIVHVTMGQSPDSKNYTDDPSYNVLIQGNADLNDGYVNPRIYTKQITKQSNYGDTILTVRAPVGEVAINNIDNSVIGRGVAGISRNEFVFYYFQWLKMSKYWDKLSAGSTFGSINSNDIRNLKIKIPTDKSERQQIALLLKDLDQQIELQRQKVADLKNQKKAYLQKMFI